MLLLLVGEYTWLLTESDTRVEVPITSSNSQAHWTHIQSPLSRMYITYIRHYELNQKEKYISVLSGSWSTILDSVFCHLFIAITDCTLIVQIAPSITDCTLIVQIAPSFQILVAFRSNLTDSYFGLNQKKEMANFFHYFFQFSKSVIKI